MLLGIIISSEFFFSRFFLMKPTRLDVCLCGMWAVGVVFEEQWSFSWKLWFFYVDRTSKYMNFIIIYLLVAIVEMLKQTVKSMKFIRKSFAL